MTRRRYRQYRWIRKLAVVMAAAPLLQFVQCANGLQQAGANVGNSIGLSNSWPVTIIRVTQTIVQLLLGGLAGSGTGI